MSEKYPSWNPYNYTTNNPLLYIDPNGLSRYQYIEGNSVEDDQPHLYVAKTKKIISETVNTLYNHVKIVWTAGDVITPAAEVASTIAEDGTPDMVSLYAYGESAYGIGTYHEIAANWMTNGPDASFFPYPTHTLGITEGWGVAGIGFGFRLGWSLGEPSMADFLDRGITVAKSVGVGIGSISGDIGISYDVALGSASVNMVTTSGGFGISIPGVGGYLAETYTLPLYEKD